MLILEATGGLVSFNFTIIAQVVSFLVLFWVLWKLLYGPVVSILEKRKAEIAAAIDSAKQIQLDAEAARKEYNERLATARREADEILEGARREAAAMKEEITREARSEADRQIARAKQDIELARKQAVGEVREQIVNLTVAAAAQVMSHSLNGEQHRKLIEETIERAGGLN